MKTVTFQRKLTLKKETVSNLNPNDMSGILAGNMRQQDITVIAYTDICPVEKTQTCDTCDCLSFSCVTIECHRTKNPADCIAVSPQSDVCPKTV